MRVPYRRIDVRYPVRPPHISNSPLFLCPLQVHWVLCVQESVLDSVVARLKLRMAGMKCVALHSDGDRALVDTAVQEAQQQGATVSTSRNNKDKLCSAAVMLTDSRISSHYDNNLQSR